MKITGLKKAVGDYKELNAGGPYDSIYGELMFNVATGEIWTDEFCSIGHNSWNVYDSIAIINLGKMMKMEKVPVTMKNVKEFIESEKWELYASEKLLNLKNRNFLDDDE